MTKVRVRHPGGSIALVVPPEATNADVATLIHENVASLEAARQIWKTGFPPKRIECQPNDTFVLNEVIHVSVAKDGEAPSVGSSPATNASSSGTDSGNGDGELLSITIPKTAPLIVDVEGLVVKRVIPADNSCLFNSIGYALLDKSLEHSSKLRRLVAKAVLDDPHYFTAAFLGKSPVEYIEFITTPSAWGGQIELLIFSRIFECEIAACDIIRNRIDIYGQESGYRRRIYVMYDGIHYDCLAYVFDTRQPPSADITQFSVHDDEVLARAKRLCDEQHRQKAFTDTSSFTLRCLVCQKGLTGAAEAQVHAQATGHANFAEY